MQSEVIPTSFGDHEMIGCVRKLNSNHYNIKQGTSVAVIINATTLTRLSFLHAKLQIENEPIFFATVRQFLELGNEFKI